MRVLPKVTDPVFVRPPSYSSSDKFFLSLIRDERDLPFIYLTLKIMFIMIPLGLILFIPALQEITWLWWILAIIYFFINNFVFKGPFGLMLHCTSHRKWFKQEYHWANSILPWLVGPFFGQTPETYFSHHIGMHHPENNLEADESTTMHYRRDSLGQWLKYLGDFLLRGMYKVTEYFRKRDRMKLWWKLVRGEVFYLALVIGLCFVNWEATLMVFILTFFFSRAVMMLGNWTQHAFVDKDDPGNPYKNSITCINVKYNHKCWNDGYHISHHIKPTLHWTEHPNHLLENLDEYAQNKAIVFDGIDFLKVWIYLLRHDYSKLADHVVNINNTFSSKEEIIAIMKSRVEKIPKGTFPPIELAA